MGRGAPCRPLGGSGLGSLLGTLLPGIGEICRPGVRIQGRVQAGGFPPLFRGAGLSSQSIGVSRKFVPNYRVFEMGPKDQTVVSIRVEETLGYDLPVARIVLDNSANGCLHRFDSAAFTREQLAFEVFLGYLDGGLVNHGKYFVQRPKFVYGGQSANRIEVVGYGEGVKLGMVERQDVYKKVRDSDIAERIADRNGFEADVDETDTVHEQVIQANESDFQFLSKRAMLHGFICAVADGVLRFQAPRPCETGIRIQCGPPQETGMAHVAVRSRTFQRGARFRMAQVDPVTGEEFDVTSSESSTEVERSLQRRRPPQDLSALSVVGRPERIIANIGHEQRRTDLQRQVDRMAEANRYVVAGVVETLGLEEVKPNTIIALEGIGRSSGKYFVTRATHTIDQNGYRTRMDVVRTANQEVQATTEVQLQSAGTVVL